MHATARQLLLALIACALGALGTAASRIALGTAASRTCSKVFAAGAFSLGGSIGQPQVAQVVTNVWTRLAEEG